MSVKKKIYFVDLYVVVIKNLMFVLCLLMWCLWLIVVVVFFVFVVLIVCVFWVQVVNQDFYVGQGQKCYQCMIEFDVMCGCIVDCNGVMFVVSLLIYEIWVNLKQVVDIDYLQIVKLFDMLFVEVKWCFGNDKMFVLFKWQVDVDIVSWFDKFVIDGIMQIVDLKCFYLEGELVVYVVGFMNVEDKGQEGVEFVVNVCL